MTNPTRLNERPRMKYRWYHRLVGMVAKPVVLNVCKQRTDSSHTKLGDIVPQIFELVSRDEVLKNHGVPSYSLTSETSGWTNNLGEMCHPDYVDVYEIGHCTIDVQYVDDIIKSVTGTVSIDAWDSCSNEIMQRNKPAIMYERNCKSAG